MKKFLKSYLKKVQKLQLMLLGDRVMYVNIFHHVYEEGEIINQISVSVKNKSDNFISFDLSDRDTEKECAVTYGRLCIFLRELGYTV